MTGDMREERAVRSTAATGTAATGAARAREPLSCDRIVQTAVDFIDRNCVADLSMRRLGAELEVEAMSLYRYFPSKAALVDAVVERLAADVRVPAGDDVEWQRAVSEYARSFRQIAVDHPRAFPLLTASGQENEAIARAAERMREMWVRIGLDRQTADRVQCAVQGFVTGTVMWELGMPVAVPIGDTTGEVGDACPPDGAVATPHTRSPEFEFGLDVLIRGLRDRLAASGTSGGNG